MTIELTGENLIGGTGCRGTGPEFRGFDPARQMHDQLVYASATAIDVSRACGLAAAAAGPFAAVSRPDRAKFLDAVAGSLLAAEAQIVPLAQRESGLPEARLKGELGRTAAQLRMFAAVLRDGTYLDIRIDDTLPERTPPRPDLRLIMQPLGPVAVFGASNFPLAFSVAGGDTSSAWAAGCPVVVKAHPAHPCTSELIGRIIQAVVAEMGLPAGVFSLLFDNGHTVGQALVSDPAITAVGFTGSRSGGLALCAVAAQRQVPIPIYAEMSAINPVLLMPGALAANGKAIGVAFAQAQTLGAGQFCTNPGLLLSLAQAELDSFIAGVASAYAAIVPGMMLTENIHATYQRSLDRLVSHRAVSVLARGTAVDGLASQPVLFGTSAAAFLSDRTLHEEVFGAASLVVRCADLTELERVLAALEGQLTASVHHAPSDCGEMARLMPILQQRAGRVLFGGFGTGVEVCDAMVHGGPFPATSDSRSTSVGSMAISRFLRPICFQDAPQELLPVDLRNAALAALPHRRNGVMIKP